MNKSTQQFTDLELLQGFRNDASREKYFALIMQQYQKRVYYYIRRMVLDHYDTDDILQNTFIKVWKGLPNFREESQLYTWIYKIATNETFTFLNSKNKRASTSFDEVEFTISNTLSSDKNFSGDEIEMKLQVAIAALPEKQRIVFNLRYYDEMPYDDMAKVLETSVGALKASYHHAVKKVEESILK